MAKVSSISSAEMIANNEDLLFEILRRLPPKSLLRWKSVSKSFLSLISTPQFCHRYTLHNPNPQVLAALVQKPSFDYAFLHLGGNEDGVVSSFRLNFLPSAALILRSCNGLLLLSSSCGYYVCNPTTRQFRKLPIPQDSRHCPFLYFEPSRSTHYKVMWVRANALVIYSSETATCTLSACAIHLRGEFISYCVSWNGAIHWIAGDNKILSYDVFNDILVTLPDRPISLHRGNNRTMAMRIEVSNQRFLFFELCTRHFPRFEVLEMDRDYSGWSVRHRVDLSEVCSIFPSTSRRFRCCRYQDYKFKFLCLVEKEEHGESLLLIKLDRKIVAFDVTHNTIKRVYDFGGPYMIRSSLHGYRIFQYVETLACV